MSSTGSAVPQGALEVSKQRIGRRREDQIVGVSPAIQRVVEQATEAAKTDLPVILSGPTGSGKELIARAIHMWGERAAGPFQLLTCDAIPEALHAREVFGCAAGVHSLLPADYEGILARCMGGTAVLAHADHLRAEVRKNLLAAVQERAYQREGESARMPLRARLVLSVETPQAAAPFESFPQHRIELPALAERAEDILPLAAHFLQAFAHEAGIATHPGFTSDAREALLAEDWSGNVGELRERVRHAVRLTGEMMVSPEALLLASEGEHIPSFKEAKRAFETRYVAGLLRRCNGNISRAARLAKKDRKDFSDVIRRTGISPTQFRHR